MQEPRHDPEAHTAGEQSDSELRVENFTQIVHQHYAAVLGHAQRILHDLAEAEDCAQEAFAEASRLIHTLEDPRALPGWLRGIVRHRCLRRLRRRDFLLVSPTENLEAYPGPADTASDGVRERLSRVRGLIEELPRQEREVVVLFYLKECSQSEIAAFLQVSLGSVNNRLHQARQRLKKWERQMHTMKFEAQVSEPERASRVGTVVAVNGPLVHARFDPDAPLDLFDALVMLNGDGSQVERMKVCQRLGDGLALCIVTRGDEPIPLGASVLNTCRVGLGLMPYGAVPSVTAGNLEQAIRILSSQAPAETRLLETGIKAIDLLCPLAAGGFVAQVGTGGVGRMVLLDELRSRLESEPRRLKMLCLVHQSEPAPYRDWDEASQRESAGKLECYWALSTDGTDPNHTALDACDAVLHMSPLLALQGLYPAIDPEYSWSRLLRQDLVGTEHRECAERARAALVWAKWSYADPVALELLARRAHAAAHRRSQAFQPAVNASERPALERARKLQLFLSQPFDTAHELTGWPGCSVSLAQTLHATRAILDGEVDHLPTAAFAYAGTLDDVREHARLGITRSFG